MLNPKQIGRFIGDNLNINDAAIRYILTDFRPDIKTSAGRRVRCLGLILNLTCQAYTIDKDSKCLKAELTDETLAELKRQLAEYRKEVDSRAHDFVSWVRWSPQRRKKFLECCRAVSNLEFEGKGT